MNHYRISFENVAFEQDFADISPEPSRCFAHCRYDGAALDAAGETLAIATHEALHLLLADLIHAKTVGDRAAEVEEERVVGRLEKIVLRGIFTVPKTA